MVGVLLRGEEVDFTLDGVTHPITFAKTDFGYINLEDRIPIHVGGFGPRAQAFAGKLGDGLITGLPRGGTRQAHLDDFKVYALVNLLLLEPSETFDSERVIREIGSGIMVNVHYLVERWEGTGEEPPDYVRPIWNDYIRFLEERDGERQHQEMHKSHCSYLDPRQARFIMPEIIQTFSLAGQPDEIAEWLKALEREGLDLMNFIPTSKQKYHLIEHCACKVITKM